MYALYHTKDRIDDMNGHRLMTIIKISKNKNYQHSLKDNMTHKSDILENIYLITSTYIERLVIQKWQLVRKRQLFLKVDSNELFFELYRELKLYE